jgi:two-component system LytT family response regulator
MKVLIVEDEKAAIRRLISLLKELESLVEVAGITDSIKSTVNWLRDHDQPDLAFFDIQLADGISFEIFDQVEVECPVIFTTAYDQYALRAFKVNSIDYLLKPIDQEKLERAIRKYLKWTGAAKSKVIDPKTLSDIREMIRTGGYKERFVVKYGEHLRSIPTIEISHIKSESKATFLITRGNKKFLTDHSLDQLENMIDPGQFFRINRRYIIRIDSIQDIISYSNSRLRLKLKTADDPDMIVAREKVGDFKSWLER